MSASFRFCLALTVALALISGRAAAQGEPALPKVQVRCGLAGPENLDKAIEWLHGNQFQQLVSIAALARAEAFAPRRAEVARELEKLLNGNDRLVALQSTKALTVWATKDQVPSLLKALDDPSTHVRRGAIEALGTVQDKRGVAPVAGFLPKFGEREVAGRSLIRMGPIVEDEVRKYVGNADTGARQEAARVLRQLGKAAKDDAFAAALGSLNDDKVFGRLKGLKWFAKADPDHPRRAEAARDIARLMQEGGVSEKREAAAALAKWATRDEVPALLDILKEKTQSIGTRPAAMKALARLRDERATATLAEMLASPFESKEAVAALVAIGPLVEGEVLPYLEHDRYTAKAAACQVLKEVGTRKSLPPLEKTLAKATREMYGGYRDVAEAARAAIKTIKARR
jgi:HEAT repeat protein